MQKKFDNGIIIDTYTGDVLLRGQVVGHYHRCNSNYPPSLTTMGGKHVGCTNDEEIAKAALAAHMSEGLGINIDGNLFPDETWILRINDIALSCDYNPESKPKIVAKVHFNNLNVTGSSSMSKAAKHTIMEIDLEHGTFHGKERGKAKEFKFANQDAMLAKLRDHVERNLVFK